MIQRDESSPMDPNTPPPYGRDASSSRIKHDIESTRAEMDETLDALGDRLRPKALMSEVWGMLQSSGVDKEQVKHDAADFAKRAGKSTWTGVKRHPIPSLLIGAGVAWLLSESTKRGHDDETLPYAYTPRDAMDEEFAPPAHRDPNVDQRSKGEKLKDAGRSAAHRAGESAEHAKDKVRSAAGDAVHAVSSAASRAGHSVSDAGRSAGHRIAAAGSQAGHTIQHQASQAGHAIQHGFAEAKDAAAHAGYAVKRRASQWSEQASDAASRAGSAMSHAARRSAQVSKEKFDQSLEHYPLAVGAAALGTGLLVGLLLPRSRKENEWMGRRSDAVKEAARRTGSDVLHRGREVAATTLHAAADEAKAQGLTPHELAERARHVVEESTEQAKESIRKEGLTPSEMEHKLEKVGQTAKQTAKSEIDHQSHEAKEKARKEAEQAKKQM